jgi:hypothetical protein
MTQKTNVIEAQAVAVIPARQTALTPMDLISKAMESDISIERMEQLFQLQLKWEENEAKKAYHAAVAAFKSESITILKSKKVAFGDTKYSHATLGNIIQTVAPVLSAHGLSHSWEVNQEGATIAVTCHLTHMQGYSTHVTMSAGKDDSGKKNQIQQIASATTYLQRYTFLAITGLAAQDQDDDGKGSEGKKVDTIDEGQAAILETLIDEVKADVKKFCVYMKCETVASLPAVKYEAAVKMLEAKRGA